MKSKFMAILLSLFMIVTIGGCARKTVDTLDSVKEQVAQANMLETLYEHHNAIKVTFTYYGALSYDGGALDEISPEMLYAKLPDDTWALFGSDGRGTSYAVYQDAYYILRQGDIDMMGVGIFIDDGYFENEILEQVNSGVTYGWEPGDELRSAAAVNDTMELVNEILPRPGHELMFGITVGRIRAEGVVDDKSFEILSNKEYYIDKDNNERLLSELACEYDMPFYVPDYINTIRGKLADPAGTCELRLVFDVGTANEKQFNYAVPKDGDFTLMSYERYEQYEDAACTEGFTLLPGELPAELTLYMKKA